MPYLFSYKFRHLATGLLLNWSKSYSTRECSTQPVCLKNSVSPAENKLHPYFVTGFSDAESCFGLKVFKMKASKMGWTVQLVFTISLKKADEALLKQIQCFFGVGKIIYEKNKDTFTYSVSNLKDLRAIIIPHFLKYPLITQKRADFELFKLAAELISKKEHLTIEGLQRIVNIRASMNLGLSDVLKSAFPNTNPAERPKVEVTENIDPHWLAGFIDGEGCFYIGIFKSKTHKLGTVVQLRFSISQHSRDVVLMRNIINTLGCGRLQEHSTKSSVEFVVSSFGAIVEKIIPFFDKYPLSKEGVKMLDYIDFCKVVQLIKEEAHLTEESLNKTCKIKSDMRIRRIKSGLGDGSIPKREIDAPDSLPPEHKIFVYDFSTLTFSSIVYGYERLAKLLGVHVNTARRVVKSGNIYANKYIISLSELAKENLEIIKSSVKPKSTAIKVVHVYNKDKSVLLKTFPSVNAFMSFSKQSGSNVKLLCTTGVLWLGNYFLSYDLIASADNSLVNTEEFNPVLINRTTSIPVYTYSADGNTFITKYSSLRECVKEFNLMSKKWKDCCT